jgi:hypothetical protein
MPLQLHGQQLFVLRFSSFVCNKFYLAPPHDNATPCIPHATILTIHLRAQIQSDKCEYQQLGLPATDGGSPFFNKNLVINVVAVHNIHIPGTDRYMFVELPLGACVVGGTGRALRSYSCLGNTRDVQCTV